jgi:hypothetical protein
MWHPGPWTPYPKVYKPLPETLDPAAYSLNLKPCIQSNPRLTLDPCFQLQSPKAKYRCTQNFNSQTSKSRSQIPEPNPETRTLNSWPLTQYQKPWVRNPETLHSNLEIITSHSEALNPKNPKSRIPNPKSQTLNCKPQTPIPWFELHMLDPKSRIPASKLRTMDLKCQPQTVQPKTFHLKPYILNLEP